MSATAKLSRPFKIYIKKSSVNVGVPHHWASSTTSFSTGRAAAAYHLVSALHRSPHCCALGRHKRI